MRSLFQLIVVVVAVSTSLAAQSKPTPSPSPAAKPNFSGTWVFVTGSNGRGANGSSLMAYNLGRDFTVTQDDKTLTVVANLPNGEQRKMVYQLDGKVTRDATSESQIAWDGAKLVISVSVVDDMPRTQVWTLDANAGRLEVQTSLTGKPFVTTSIYQKK